MTRKYSSIPTHFPISQKKCKVKANISDTIADNSQKILLESQKRLSADGKINAELAIQDGKINAKVEKVSGNPESFGWELLYDSWTLKSSGKDVLKATKDGIDITGKIVALTGKIGPLDILGDYLSYNGQTWDGSKSTGAYLGPEGWQMGTKFQVDMQGNVYCGNIFAASGTFEGNVYAGNIQYGDGYGTLDGSGLTSHSVYGSQIVYNTISTAYTSSGINTSLGYANFSDDVFNGNDTAGYVGTTNLKLDGHWLNRASVTISGVSLKYVSWV